MEVLTLNESLIIQLEAEFSLFFYRNVDTPLQVMLENVASVFPDYKRLNFGTN